MTNRFEVRKNGHGFKVVHTSGSFFGPWPTRKEAKAVAKELDMLMDGLKDFDDFAHATHMAKQLLKNRDVQLRML
jgi:hypothetical protein